MYAHTEMAQKMFSVANAGPNSVEPSLMGVIEWARHVCDKCNMPCRFLEVNRCVQPPTENLPPGENRFPPGTKVRFSNGEVGHVHSLGDHPYAVLVIVGNMAIIVPNNGPGQYIRACEEDDEGKSQL
jgi:hypothetical protein